MQQGEACAGTLPDNGDFFFCLVLNDSYVRKETATARLRLPRLSQQQAKGSRRLGSTVSVRGWCRSRTGDVKLGARKSKSCSGV